MKKCLNIACGLDYKESNNEEEWVNVDKSPEVKCDYVVDVLKSRLIFNANSFDIIICKNFLMHIDYSSASKLVEEIHRLLKINGIFKCNAIHYSSRLASEPLVYQSYSYKLLIDLLVVHYNLNDYFSFQQKSRNVPLFIIKSVRFHWKTKERLELKVEKWGLALTITDAALSFLASIFPNFCDRIWCNLVGGFEIIDLVCQKREEKEK